MPSGYKTGGHNALTDQVKGNKNQSKTKPWKDAIRKALKQYEGGPKNVRRGDALRKIADELVAAALDRNDPNFQFAVKEIGLRQDGKPTETHEIGDSTQRLIGISQAFALLSDFAREPETVHGTTIVQDRPVLPSEVRLEEGGCGEGVGVSEDQGCSGES